MRLTQSGKWAVITKDGLYLRVANEHGVDWTEDLYEAWHTTTDSKIAERLATRLGATILVLPGPTS